MSLASDYRPGRYQPEDIAPEQTALATELRVPFVTSDSMRWSYVCAVLVGEPWPGSPWTGIAPTDDEVRMIASFVGEYRAHWYNDWFVGLMAGFAPYDIDGGANLAVLRKDPSGSWWWRKRTWTLGPRWVPTTLPDEPPTPLIDVLDRVHTMAGEVWPRWEEWKASHPEVFGASK